MGTCKTNFRGSIWKSSLSRPNTTIQHSYINDIKKIISNVDPADSFNSWDHIYLDELRWTKLVEALESKQSNWDNSNWKYHVESDDSNKFISHTQTPSSPSSSHYSSRSEPSLFVFIPIMNLGNSNKFLPQRS